MHLDAKQSDRAVGVMLASAAGDALGVPYEYGSRPLDGEPQMLGGASAASPPDNGPMTPRWPAQLRW